MNILILGSNAGSHFMAQKLLEMPNVKNVYHHSPNIDVPPSYGYHPIYSTRSLVENKSVILDLVKRKDIDLIIPMSVHFQLWPALHDEIAKSNIPVFMPSKEIGLLEWSKIHGKKLLKEAGVPTPSHRVVSMEELVKNFKTIPRPYVIKYDKDWRAGKQTIVITDDNVEEEYIVMITDGERRNTGTIMGKWDKPTFAVEDYVKGTREYSYHAVCNDTGWRYVGSARDYKKRFDGDLGHNTAGMGAYSPVDINPVVHTYVDKILACLKNRGISYKGMMYLGIMEVENSDPVVLEINTRPGDPEWQTISGTIETNLADLFLAAAKNEPLPEVKFNNKHSVSVRVVHEDYDEFNYVPKQVPSVIEGTPDVTLSHNTTRNLFLTVATATGDSVQEAREKVYKFLDPLDLGEFTYRKDIGLRP